MKTDPSSSPIAFFASEVKRLRGIAGMTQEQLAKATVYSPASVAAIETCRLLPSKQFAQGADIAFESDGQLERLQDLVEQTSVLPWFRDLVEVERRATDIRAYEPYQVAALLQTEDYMRAIARVRRPMLSENDIDRAVALRMTRQEILDHEQMPPLNQDISPRLWVIMDQSALQRIVGGPEIMRAQCEHLISMSKRPNITVQVIPNRNGATCAFGRAFSILVSKSEPLVYVEDIGSARYIRKTDEASQYLLVFDHLRASALDDERSAAMIRDSGQ